MHLLALTRWNQSRTLDAELPWLAPLMRVVPYEARLRLNAGSPVVLARGLALSDAQQGLSALRAHGHGAIAIDEDGAPQDGAALIAGSFELQADQLVVVARNGQQRLALPYAQLLALVRAIEVCEEETATQTVEHKLSLGRAVLSGGLMNKKAVTKTHNEKSLEHEHVAYLFRRDAGEPVLLREHSLRYAGLGDQRGENAHQSFMRLLALLRERTPHALHDDRLCVRKRRAELTTVRGTTREQTRSSTNVAANLLAAYILVHGFVQGQL